MSQAPDLFVVCKTCNNEVSPYITECPYCGTRLRKRAPKIEKDGSVADTQGGRTRAAGKPPKPPKPAKPPKAERARRVRRASGTRPSWKGERKPWATYLLVGLSVLGYIVLRALPDDDIALVGQAAADKGWPIATTVFLYGSAMYQLACVLCIGLFAWLLERRHGPLVPLLLFAACAIGGAGVVAAVDPSPLALGGNGGALGLLAAWVVPDLLRARRGEEVEGDLLGVGVLAVVVLLMPAALAEANAIAGVVGGALGLVAGLLLPRR